MSMRSALIPLSALACAGCPDQTPASDVRGNYDITFDDALTIKLDIGGARQEASGSESGVVTFQINGQPVELDLAVFCGKPEVQCPSEVLWSKVSIDQPNIAAQVPNSHVVNVIDNRVHDLPGGVAAQLVSGLVDQADSYTLLIGGDSRGGGSDCGLLALSIAEGRFTHEGEQLVQEPVAPAPPAEAPDGGPSDAGPEEPLDGGFIDRVTFPPGAPVNGIAPSRLRVGYLGVCAFGPAVVGATLELSTGYTGARTGALDPPPFTPVDPETVPDGIADAGVADVDAGT